MHPCSRAASKRFPNDRVDIPEATFALICGVVVVQSATAHFFFQSIELGLTVIAYHLFILVVYQQ